ncbi:MAG: hypothetical protein JW862_04460 [Anaerolineales bacterium]|nr:hypothetical protein [Anaerolineales bacterium]
MYLNHCNCEICSLGVAHPEQVLHKHVNLLMSRLDEQQRRWLAALLAEKYGLSIGGVHLVSQVTGLAEKTVRRGLREIENGFEGRPNGGARLRKKSSDDFFANVEY